MKKIDKYYYFLSLFGDSQEKATLGIRDLAGCKFRTAKIRNIISNVKFEENFEEIEPFIDIVLEMVDKGFDISKHLESDKYTSLNDDAIFKIEEIDEIGFEKFKEEFSLLGINVKCLEYLYYREVSLKEKANKEIYRLRCKINSLMTKEKKIIKFKHSKKTKQLKLF